MKIMFISIVTLLATSMFAIAQTQPASGPVAAPAPTAAQASVQTPSQTVTVTTITPPTANVAPPPAAAPTPELVKQPTTVVEAAPLTTSHADDLRKSREQTEVETEQKIVEKLEQSRMTDEKKRQEKVLNSMSDEKKTEDVVVVPAPAPATVAPVAAPVVIQAAPIAPAPQPALAPTQELTASAADLAPEQSKPENKYFASLGVGMMSYNNSPDVKNFGSYGFSFGKIMDSFALSADFGYNSLNQSLDPYGFYYRSVNQYTLGMTGRYIFPLGKFRPSVGAAIDYVRRSYSGIQEPGYTTSLVSMNSNALDYGLVGALDYQVSDHMSVGVEYRYMMNLTYQYDNQSGLNTANQVYDIDTLETRNYQTWTAALRYMY